MKFPAYRYFKTGKRLQALINSGAAEFDEWCEQYMATLYEIELDGYSSLPYWIEPAALRNRNSECDCDDYLVEYRAGYHEPLSLGDTRTIEGVEYRYLDSVPLCAELELQAHDGKCSYAYQGESFLRVWERVLSDSEQVIVTD
jgi:hypothetical protein